MFIPVYLDGDDENAQANGERFAVLGYPTMIVFDADGTELTRIPNGIDIQADRGEPVRCVGAGTVVFADWFKNYGNMIIVDHGHGLSTVYMHLHKILVKEGQPVPLLYLSVELNSGSPLTTST